MKKQGILLPLLLLAVVRGLQGPDDAEGPLKSLRGFQRLAIPAGATAEAVFPLSEETFLYWSPEQRDLVPLSGDWELLYGGRSYFIHIS